MSNRSLDQQYDEPEADVIQASVAAVTSVVKKLWGVPVPVNDAIRVAKLREEMEKGLSNFEPFRLFQQEVLEKQQAVDRELSTTQQRLETLIRQHIALAKFQQPSLTQEYHLTLQGSDFANVKGNYRVEGATLLLSPKIEPGIVEYELAFAQANGTVQSIDLALYAADLISGWNWREFVTEVGLWDWQKGDWIHASDVIDGSPSPSHIIFTDSANLTRLISDPPRRVRILFNAAGGAKTRITSIEGTLICEGGIAPPGGEIVPPTTAGTSTMFVVDVSTSMNDPWQGKTKLQAAQVAVGQTLDLIAMEAAGTKQHQAGLVAFSNSADEKQSLTSDWETLRDAVEMLNTIGGTNLGAGLVTAMHSLDTAPGDKLIILLSDGKTNEGLSRDEILSGPTQEAAQAKIKIYTVGMGNPKKLDEASLREIAKGTDGTYCHAANAQKLAQVYRRLRHQAVGDIVLEDTGTVQQGETTTAQSLVIPLGTHELHLSLSWPGSELDIVLIDPQGHRVDNQYLGAQLQHRGSQKYLVIRNPVPGTWKASVFGKSVPKSSTQYQLLTSVRRSQRTAIAGGGAAPLPHQTTTTEKSSLLCLWY